MEGYLEQVMAAAKRAGGNGGTVIKGRGLANVMPTKILGFNIEPERELVLNVVLEKDKNKVMEEISKEVGIDFYYYDFRPYYKEGQEEARRIGIYMQKYCGCVFSEEDRYLKKKKDYTNRVFKIYS